VCGLQFNLSHSHDLALIAVAHDQPVGVDVEFIRSDTAVMQIADRFFAARESAALRALPEQQQRRAFFDTWTRKEAWLKARGVGLGGALDQCVDEQTDWLVQGLSVGPGYSAALAVGGADVTLRRWQAPAVSEGAGELL
jgi:4'-phosphopantetheinyl transferase